MSVKPQLAELLNDLRKIIERGIRVALPGRVLRYDATQHVADIRPEIFETFENVEGERVDEQLPVLVNVPIIFPGAGGFRITFPVQVGDPVQLLFNDRSMDAWMHEGHTSSPADRRRHHLADAVAIPGLRPTQEAWQDADPSTISIGADTGVHEFVATAQRVLTELNKIKTAFDAHTHAVTGSSATGGPVTGVASAPNTPIPSLSAPASATVKIKG